MNRLTKSVAYLLLVPLLLAGAGTAARAQNPYRGLWVGQIQLTHVNEVPVPLDDKDVPIAPDPDVPTQTSDEAQLRLIVHVNWQGQAHLLKDVAILSRVDPENQSSIYASESDLALVTDERLYPDFPVQEARRIASAMFDFGDARSTVAVDEVVDRVATSVAANVMASGVTLSSTTLEVRAVEDDAEQAGLAAANPVLQEARTTARFSTFLADHLSAPRVQTIAAAVDPATEAATAIVAAEALRDESFYGDERGVNAIDDMLDAISATVGVEAKKDAALAVVARYADTAGAYERFVTGSRFGDLVTAAAQAAGAAAAATGAVPADVSLAVTTDTTVLDVKNNDAPAAEGTTYNDTAATDAVNTVLNAVIAAAQATLGSPPVIESEVVQLAEAAGLTAAQAAPRYPLQTDVPSPDYVDFIATEAFQGSVAAAAEQAAVETVSVLRQEPFSTLTSLEGAARIAATEALNSVYAASARAALTALPLDGTFAPGEGDPRVTADLHGASLDPAALTGTIYLPASHPTNPFRHPKHPDHTRGFNIRRMIRIDFDGLPDDPLERSGLGVEKISGRFREEIHGLHKPLGPDPANQPVGLKVEGPFELFRISQIDTLNAL